MWHRKEKVWFTKDIQVAAKFREYASQETEKFFKKFLIEVKSWDGVLPGPPPGLTLQQHQTQALYFALERTQCYLALSPGLGKTIVAAMLSLAINRRVVYITPPFLVENIKAEYKRWAPSLAVGTLKDKLYYYDVLLVPDSIITRPDVIEEIKTFEGHMLVVDEAHRFKNYKSKRTTALLGKARKKGIFDLFERVVFMSGTPMPNRPMELFPILNRACPALINHMNRYEFGMYYCDPKHGDFGMEFNGASNLRELAGRIMGKYMLRIKKDVLDLPPKTEEVFFLSAELKGEIKKLNHSIMKHIKAKDDDDAASLIINGVEFDASLHIATYRRMLGLEKAKLSVPYIRDLLEESDESILVFAHHKEAINCLVEELEEHKPFVITGATKVESRQSLVAEFQKSKTRKLFIGSYIAMGVGFTLTKATRVIFVEFDWVPGVNEQAADRCHRIGQNYSVLVQYMVFPKSLDAAVIAALLHKRMSANQFRSDNASFNYS